MRRVKLSSRLVVVLWYISDTASQAVFDFWHNPSLRWYLTRSQKYDQKLCEHFWCEELCLQWGNKQVLFIYYSYLLLIEYPVENVQTLPVWAWNYHSSFCKCNFVCCAPPTNYFFTNKLRLIKFIICCHDYRVRSNYCFGQGMATHSQEHLRYRANVIHRFTMPRQRIKAFWFIWGFQRWYQ